MDVSFIHKLQGKCIVWKKNNSGVSFSSPSKMCSSSREDLLTAQLLQTRTQPMGTHTTSQNHKIMFLTSHISMITVTTLHSACVCIISDDGLFTGFTSNTRRLTVTRNSSITHLHLCIWQMLLSIATYTAFKVQIYILSVLAFLLFGNQIHDQCWV